MNTTDSHHPYTAASPPRLLPLFLVRTKHSISQLCFESVLYTHQYRDVCFLFFLLSFSLRSSRASALVPTSMSVRVTTGRLVIAGLPAAAAAAVSSPEARFLAACTPPECGRWLHEHCGALKCSGSPGYQSGFEPEVPMPSKSSSSSSGC